ncbi:MAG: TRAP transporter small permease subunit [Planctomycetaceae bacterium]
MNRLGSVIEKIADLGGYFSGCLVPLMMILVVVEVFTRYVLDRPLMVADEVSAYMLVALSFLGLAYTWRQGGHVRISILVSRLPGKAAAWVRLIGLIMTFIFMIELDRAAYKMIVYALQINLRSSTWLMFPLFWPQLTVFIGFILLTLLLVIDFFRTGVKIRTGKKAEA